MKFFEMVGMPGVGKSTICNPVYEKLLDSGYRVCTLKKLCYWSHSFPKKIFAIFDSFLNFRLWNVYVKCYKFSKMYHSHVFHCKYFWLLILITNELYKVNRKKIYDYIIFDEGIAQIITSISHNKDLILNTYLEEYICILEKYNIKPTLIRCNLDIDNCLKRIRKRGSQFAVRFSKEKNDDNLKLLLQNKNDNIEKILSLFDVIVEVNMDESIDSNVNKVFNIIT